MQIAKRMIILIEELLTRSSNDSLADLSICVAATDCDEAATVQNVMATKQVIIAGAGVVYLLAYREIVDRTPMAATGSSISAIIIVV